MVHVEAFFDKETNTLTYVVHDEATRDGVVIDPVLDYEPQASQITHASAAQVSAYVKKKGITPWFILETHPHADHLSGAQVLKKDFPKAKIGIGENIKIVQKTFKNVFNLGPDFPTDGSQFDVLFKDNDTINAGSLRIKVLATPGHTPACVAYVIGDAVFTGDVLFMPDSGTGRCDFPNGDAKNLYHSIMDKLYKLPGATRTFTGHDYMPNNRPLQFESTIAQHQAANIHIPATKSEADYIEFRRTRDATLKAPRLLLHSIQVNIAAGILPKAETNGVRYLKMPITES